MLVKNNTNYVPKLFHRCLFLSLLVFLHKYLGDVYCVLIIFQDYGQKPVNRNSPIPES